MALTLADAVVIPLLASEIGIPMAGMDMLGSLGATDAALAGRIATQAAAYRGTGPEVGKQIVEIEKLLAKSGLPVPARPNTYAEYVRWNDACAHAVAAATGPEVPEGALAAFGRCMGDLMQAVALHVVVLELRELAPVHEGLRTRDDELAAACAKAATRVDAMSKFPTLPAIARPHAEQLAVFARMIPVLDRETGRAAQAAGLKMIFGKLAEHVRGLRIAIT